MREHTMTTSRQWHEWRWEVKIFETAMPRTSEREDTIEMGKIGKRKYVKKSTNIDRAVQWWISSQRNTTATKWAKANELSSGNVADQRCMCVCVWKSVANEFCLRVSKEERWNQANLISISVGQPKSTSAKHTHYWHSYTQLLDIRVCWLSGKTPTTSPVHTLWAIKRARPNRCRSIRLNGTRKRQ